MNIFNHKHQDSINADYQPSSARYQMDWDNQVKEVVLSDVLRSSKLNDDQQLNNAIKSPFMLYSKESDTCLSS